MPFIFITSSDITEIGPSSFWNVYLFIRKGTTLLLIDVFLILKFWLTWFLFLIGNHISQWLGIVIIGLNPFFSKILDCFFADSKLAKGWETNFSRIYCFSKGIFLKTIFNSLDWCSNPLADITLRKLSSVWKNKASSLILSFPKYCFKPINKFPLLISLSRLISIICSAKMEEILRFKLKKKLN